jgi:D-glycero-D-manno-heptose 1,7-bisphosphate phosphatase
VRKLNDAGLKVFVISNQSGVARGRFTEPVVEQIHERLKEELAEAGARLDAIYYCPHHPEGVVEAYRAACGCRKPKPGMLLRAAREWGLDLTHCYVIGDKYVDVDTAHAAGAHGVLVLTGYGREQYEHERHLWPRPPVLIAEDVLQAADWILARTREPEATPCAKG